MRTAPAARLGNPTERAARWLAAWDAQGLHRTATAGDEAGAAWLASEAAALAAPGTCDVSIEEFAIDRLDPAAAFLEIGGRRIPAIPAFDAAPTGPDGIVGRLGGEIAVAELSPQAVYSGEFARLHGGGRHRGLVVVCAGNSPGMALLNAERFRTPYAAPAIHVSSEARELVLAAAARGLPARLVADSRRTQAVARNVVVAFPGTNGDGAPLAVVTPRSSWWQSTAERGGGIVCWLESLRALAAAPPQGPVVFTANTGHELGHIGLDEFVARRPGWDRPARQGGATWVLYGANIGADDGRLSVISPQDDLRRLAAAALQRAGQPHRVAASDVVPNGETRDIHRAGGRCLTLVGTNRLFHQPDDRWPAAVDLAAVTRTAAAVAQFVQALTRPAGSRAGPADQPAPLRVISLARPGRNE